MQHTDYSLKPIGIIHSCYKEKFGIPRQPGLVPEANAILELLPPYDREEALKGLEDFSHLWIVFIFHAALRDEWSPTVRPPRLGGNQRLGVFATRSPFRPNPIGLSVVELESYGREKGKLLLHLKGVDLLDGTPVLDIKPYVPYADAIPDAQGGFAAEQPNSGLSITFSEEAQQQCEQWQQKGHDNLQRLIEQTLACDPRPAYQAERGGKSQFGMRLLSFDVQWQVNGEQVMVTGIHPISD